MVLIRRHSSRVHMGPMAHSCMQEWKINTVYPGIKSNSSDTFKLHAESDEKRKHRDVQWM